MSGPRFFGSEFSLSDDEDTVELGFGAHLNAETLGLPGSAVSLGPSIRGPFQVTHPQLPRSSGSGNSVDTMMT